MNSRISKLQKYYNAPVKDSNDIRDENAIAAAIRDGRSNAYTHTNTHADLYAVADPHFAADGNRRQAGHARRRYFFSCM